MRVPGGFVAATRRRWPYVPTCTATIRSVQDATSDGRDSYAHDPARAAVQTALLSMARAVTGSVGMPGGQFLSQMKMQSRPPPGPPYGGRCAMRSSRRACDGRHRHIGVNARATWPGCCFSHSCVAGAYNSPSRSRGSLAHRRAPERSQSCRARRRAPYAGFPQCRRGCRPSTASSCPCLPAAMLHTSFRVHEAHRAGCAGAWTWMRHAPGSVGNTTMVLVVAAGISRSSARRAITLSATCDSKNARCPGVTHCRTLPKHAST